VKAAGYLVGVGWPWPVFDCRSSGFRGLGSPAFGCTAAL